MIESKLNQYDSHKKEVYEYNRQAVIFIVFELVYRCLRMN